MRKVLVCLAVLGAVLGSGVPARAQSGGVSGGVRAGVNLADLSFDPAPPFDSKTLAGMVVGAFLIVPANATIAFQPEVLFSRQGTKFEEAGTTVTTRFDYVQVPLLARLRVAPQAPVAILFGPSLGIRTHASFDSTDIPQEVLGDPNDAIKRHDFGFVAGAAFDIGHVVIDGRYTWGLANISKDDTGSAKNRVITFSVGLRF